MIKNERVFSLLRQSKTNGFADFVKSGIFPNYSSRSRRLSSSEVFALSIFPNFKTRHVLPLVP